MKTDKSADPIFSIPVRTIQQKETTLEPYRGQVLLIVNTASQCGLTPQYEGLEKLYAKHRAQGLTVLGFPCNQFGAQEPGTEAEIQSFCDLNYKVTFPIFAKIEVNGAGTHPLYKHLKSEGKGILNTEAIKWNFTKFLVARDGTVLKRFAPTATPEEIEPEIVKALNAK